MPGGVKDLQVNRNFKDLLLLFNRYHVRYLVVGAYAVMSYTEPRNTKDLDVWVDIALDNAKRVYQALAEFGAPLKRYTPEDFAKRYSVFQMGVPPQRIDILGNISAVRFSTAWEKRKTRRPGGMTVHFIALDDLMKNKKAVGRAQDLIDLENLRRWAKG
jgi:hypothetical protein